MLCVSIDNLASRYGCLPSQVLANASTLDLTILDIATKYNEYRNSDSYEQNHGMSENTLQEMLERARG